MGAQQDATQGAGDGAALVAGSHCDVGGGAAREGHDEQSDYCLDWLLSKAAEAGLEIDRSRVAWHLAPDSQFPHLHLDAGLFYRLLALIRAPLLRPIGKGVPEGKEGHGRPSNETVDEQARRRLQEDASYRARNLMAWEAEQV